MFIADSAYQFCQQQCDFGPRTMNSTAHDACGDWIVRKFQQYGMTVTRQEATLKGFDGTPLKSTNIIASYLPEQTARLLLCAHWDSRPWADNDPDEANCLSGAMRPTEVTRGLWVPSTGQNSVPGARPNSTVLASCSTW